MIRIKQAVIVEGKYDKIRLSNIIDAVIIPTNGFSIYKDKETAELIRTFAKTTGIIILTDSDSAGFQIRSRIREIARGGEIINVYIPDIEGRERRKREDSKEGLLGVEGIGDKLLIEAFRRAGVLCENYPDMPPKADPITKADLLDLGLVGADGASGRREKLQKRLGLPRRLSANMLLEILNVMYTREEFVSFCKNL